jgi:hypothetical protein
VIGIKTLYFERGAERGGEGAHASPSFMTSVRNIAYINHGLNPQLQTAAMLDHFLATMCYCALRLECVCVCVRVCALIYLGETSKLNRRLTL